MKLLLVFMLVHAMFSLAFAQGDVVTFNKTVEGGTINRFEAFSSASSDDKTSSDEEKRALIPICGRQTCRSGYVQSKYCTYAAKKCFGTRGQVVRVRFVPPFRRRPKVMIGLTLVDTHKDHNVRVRATAESVKRTGFIIRFRPWDTSITYRIGVNWMACP